MVIGYLDCRHDGSSSPVYGSAPSVRRGGIGAPSSDIVPSRGLHASVKNAPQAKRISSSPTATCDSAARLIRAARLRDLLAAVEEWRRASGPDRVWWRHDAQHRLAEWRRLHVLPERAAFQAAVAKSLKS